MPRSRPTRRTVLIALGATAAVGRSRGADARDVLGIDQRSVAVRIARDVVVPAYQAFAEAAREQAEVWDAFRADPLTSDGPARLTRAFQDAADAWAGIEAVRSGPIAEENRFERVAHWPERRNAVARALAGLLAGQEELTLERLRRASVAGQGLTALERLLFGDARGGAATAAQELSTGAGERRRALGSLIASNLADIGARTLSAWTRDDGEAAAYGRARPEEAREILTRLATDQLAHLDGVGEAKIGAVLGPSPDDARPLLAEGWRAGRSLRAVEINLAAAEAFAGAALAHDKDRLRPAAAGLAAARSLAADLAGGGADLGDLAGGREGRLRLTLLRDAVASAHALCGRAFAEGLAVTIGFNSRDGD